MADDDPETDFCGVSSSLSGNRAELSCFLPATRRYLVYVSSWGESGDYQFLVRKSKPLRARRGNCALSSAPLFKLGVTYLTAPVLCVKPGASNRFEYFKLKIGKAGVLAFADQKINFGRFVNFSPFPTVALYRGNANVFNLASKRAASCWNGRCAITPGTYLVQMISESRAGYSSGQGLFSMKLLPASSQ